MTKAELQKATGDIYYEAQMLYDTYMNYWKHEPLARNGQPQWLHYCIIEATLIHTRALLVFFERTRTTPLGQKPPRKDEVFAEDYSFAPECFPFSSDLRKRINTSIAHLSYGRTQITDDKRYWDFVGFIPPILFRSADFFRHLLDSRHPRSSYPGDPTIEQFIANAKAQNPS